MGGGVIIVSSPVQRMLGFLGFLDFLRLLDLLDQVGLPQGLVLAVYLVILWLLGSLWTSVSR